MLFVGEIAGFSVACFRAMSGIMFSDAGTRIGSFYVNKIRLVIATVLFALSMLIINGTLLTAGLNSQHWMWLGISAFVGLVFGDACGFKALVMIGPRLETLVRTSTPIITAIIAWFFLGEQLRWHDIIGIAITVSGIAWVVSERKIDFPSESLHPSHPDSGSIFAGILFGLGSAFGQAAGLVLAKHAMTRCGTQVDPLSAAFLRMLMATAVIWTYSAIRGEARTAVTAIKEDRGALRLILWGSLFAPFLGIWMSFVAVRHVEAGIAETLGSMTPVVILPLLWKFKKEEISWRAVAGAVVAVGGVAAIFLIP
ncbi:MAG: DMT family transporter [Candidatus Zixiibacteriota bacterium]